MERHDIGDRDRALALARSTSSVTSVAQSFRTTGGG